MLETDKSAIVEFLRSTDPEMDFNQASLSLADCVDLLMDKITELELDYSILSTAFINGVNPDRFDDFHDAIMNQYEMIADGSEIPEPVLDRIASSYK